MVAVRRRAFTVTELLAVIVIIAIVAALTYPIFAGSKRSAKIQGSKARLRQLSIATMLYRTEHDGDGKYGPVAEMGLPAFEDLITPLTSRGGPPLPQFKDFGKIEMWKSPCGPNPAWDSAADYVYRPGEAEATFVKEVTERREDYALFVDFTCGSPEVNPRMSSYSHRVLGVRLSGELFDVTRVGAPLIDSGFWYR